MEGFLDKVKAVVVGHAVGDALGVPVEFLSRRALEKNPVTDMLGYGSHNVPKGTWSDDTSMALCTLDVLGKYGLKYELIMVNFAKWYYENAFTATGRTFDVGGTCGRAIINYVAFQKPYIECGLNGENANGNGSLMRIHPVVLYLSNKEIKIDEKIQIVHTVSALTHAHKRSKIGCGIYAFVLWELLQNPDKQAVFDGLRKAETYYQGEAELTKYRRLFDKTFIVTKRENIKSSGYVVDTLEAAIWCLLTENGYEKTVLKAVNLGADTDTVAAVTGGLAGALYGYEGIPEKWRKELLCRAYIESLCEGIG